MSNVHEIFMHISCGRGLFLLWQRRDTLRTSGYADDVMFVHNWPNKGNASRATTRSGSSAPGAAADRERSLMSKQVSK